MVRTVGRRAHAVKCQLAARPPDRASLHLDLASVAHPLDECTLPGWQAVSVADSASYALGANGCGLHRHGHRLARVRFASEVARRCMRTMYPRERGENFRLKMLGDLV